MEKKSILVLTLPEARMLLAKHLAENMVKDGVQHMAEMMAEDGIGVFNCGPANMRNETLFTRICEEELGEKLAELNGVDLVVVEVGDPKSVEYSGDTFEVIGERVKQELETQKTEIYRDCAIEIDPSGQCKVRYDNFNYVEEIEEATGHMCHKRFPNYLAAQVYIDEKLANAHE